MKKFILLILCLLLISCSPQKEIKLGVMSDIHGNLEGLEKIVSIFETKNLDGIIITGDSVLNEELRYGNKDSVEDSEELNKVLEIISNLKIPIYIIPGNHETKTSYYKTIKNFNVTDMSKERFVELENLAIISLPGYYLNQTKTNKFLPDDGFFANNNSILELKEMTYYANKPILLISHGPPEGKNGIGLDVITNGQNVGSKLLYNTIKDNIKFAIFGHIHESRNAYTSKYSEIQENEISQELWLNSGAVENNEAAILTIYDNYALYELIN